MAFTRYLCLLFNLLYVLHICHLDRQCWGMLGDSEGIGIPSFTYMTHRPTAKRHHLTVDFLQHDGVEEVSGCHVGLLFEHHGRELVEANFSGRQLRGCGFLKQKGGKCSERQLGGVRSR